MTKRASTRNDKSYVAICAFPPTDSSEVIKKPTHAPLVHSPLPKMAAVPTTIMEEAKDNGN
jgi:hypothetical protein